MEEFIQKMCDKMCEKFVDEYDSYERAEIDGDKNSFYASIDEDGVSFNLTLYENNKILWEFYFNDDEKDDDEELIKLLRDVVENYPWDFDEIYSEWNEEHYEEPYNYWNDHGFRDEADYLHWRYGV